VNATLGRQLFVDTFLIQSARIQRTGSPAAWEPVADLEDLIEFHTATVHPVSPLFPHEVERVHPWVDGTVWNGERGVFEHFFACTDPSITCGAFIGWRTCMATSRDGVKFGRVRRVDLPTGDHPRDCRATRERGKVVRDPSEPDPGKRYKFGLFLAKRINDTEIGRARTPATRYHVFFSANGMRWEKGFEAGVVLDTSGMHFDPFRRVWAFSLKENFMYYIRTARYYEVASISYPFSWPNYLERCYSKVHELDQGHMFLKWKPCFAATGPSHASPETRLFLAADNADTPYNHESDYFNVSGATPGTYRDVPQEYRRVTDLYMFDATAYESLMVAFFSIHSAGDAYPKQIEPHVAFSRDGFHYSRVPRGRRSPFLDTARTNCEQFACNVDGITAGHELLFYCGATEIRPDRDLAANPIHMFADEGKTLVFRLRRDGFASLGLRDTVHKDVSVFFFFFFSLLACHQKNQWKTLNLYLNSIRLSRLQPVVWFFSKTRPCSSISISLLGRRSVSMTHIVLTTTMLSSSAVQSTIRATRSIPQRCGAARRTIPLCL
jgi:hypothetical protein